MDNKKLEQYYDKLLLDQYYPFFQFTGNSVEIYVGKDLIAKIYTNNKYIII